MKEWSEIKEESGESHLFKTFSFKNFSEAFGFMAQVALLVEKHDHHPWWSNVYNKVEIKLSTHDAGNTITKKDLDLAKGIDAILN